MNDGHGTAPPRASAAQGLSVAGVRRRNLLSLLSILRDGRDHSTPEMSEELGLDASTITRLLGTLRRQHLVRQTGVYSVGGIGRPRKIWRIASRAGMVVGFSIAVDRIDGIALTLDGEVLAEASHTDAPSTPPPSLAAAVRRVHDELIARSGAIPVLAAGIASTGAVESSAGIVRAGGATVWNPAVVRDLPLGNLIAAELGCPVVVGNDANVAAMAAFRQGVAAGELSETATLVYLLGVPRAALWWGGVGLVVHGRLHTGSNGLAGELFLDGPANIALEPEPERSKLAEAARGVLAGDAAAAERLREPLRRNVRFLAGIALPLDPARIVFGGSYAAFGATLDSLIAETRQEVSDAHLWLESLPAPELSRDALWPRTVELGAAEMALDRLYRPDEPEAWDLLTRLGKSDA